MADPIIIKPIDLKPAKNYQGSLPFNNDCCAPLFPEESATPTPTPSSVTQTPTPTPTLTPTPTIIPPTPEPSASRPAATPTPTPTSTSFGSCKFNTWYVGSTYIGEDLSIEGLVSGACRVSSGTATPGHAAPEEHWYLVKQEGPDPYIQSYQIFEPAASIALGKTSLWSGQEANRTLFIQGEPVYINYPVNDLDSRYSGYYYIKNIENIVPDPDTPITNTCANWHNAGTLNVANSPIQIKGLTSGAIRKNLGEDIEDPKAFYIYKTVLGPLPGEVYYGIGINGTFLGPGGADKTVGQDLGNNISFIPGETIEITGYQFENVNKINGTYKVVDADVTVYRQRDQLEHFFFVTLCQSPRPSSSAQSNITRTRISLSCTRTSSCIGLEDSSPDLYLLDNIEPELVIATTEDGKTFKKKHSFEIERVQFGPGTYRFICGYTIDKEDLDNVISSQDNNSGILTVNTDYAKKIRAIIAPDGPTNLITVDTSEATEVDGSGYFVGLIKVTVPQASSLPDDPNKSIFITLETIDYNTHVDRIFYDPSCPNQLHPTATPTPTSSGPAPSPTPTPSFTPTVTPTLTSTPSPTPTTSSADPLTRAWDFSKTLIWGVEATNGLRIIRRAPEYDPSGGGNNGREATKNLYLIGADKDSSSGNGVYPNAEWYSTTWITAKDDQGGNMQSRLHKFNVGQTVNIYYPGGPAHPTLGVRGTNKNGYHNLSGSKGSTTRPNIIDQELSTLTVRKFERLRAEDPLNLTNEDVIRVWFSRTPPEPPPPEFGEGIVVKFETNAPLADPNFYVKLTPNTPITNNNFLGYVRRGDYNNTFFHRSIEDFVIQGGGFKTPINNSDQPNSDPTFVQTRGTIRNEPYNKNVIGTIAMAKLGGQPDSATSQFYFNLDNNYFLNSDNGGYTVFGNVLTSDNNNTIQDGMVVVNLLGSELTYDATNFYGKSFNTNFQDLPFYFDRVPRDNIVKPSDFLQIKKVTIVQE